MPISTVAVRTASPHLEGRSEQVAWKGVSMASGLIVGLIVQRLLSALRRKLTSSGDAPLNPADERVSWGQALTWSIAAAVGVAAARVVGDRLAAMGWEMATGKPPPGIEV